MIVKVSGKVDGQDVIFERSEGNQWNITVPYDLDGMYVIEVTAENDAGNVAYCTKMLLIVDPATLCVKLVPLDYMVEVVPEEYETHIIPEDYLVEVMEEQYQVATLPDLFYVEVVYPIHGKGCCCEQRQHLMSWHVIQTSWCKESVISMIIILTARLLQKKKEHTYWK